MLASVLFEILFPKYAKRYYEMHYEIEKLEKDRDRCRNDLTFRMHKDNTLHVCGTVRGNRYNEIKLPKWYQEHNAEELGESFIHYVKTEVIPSKRKTNKYKKEK